MKSLCESHIANGKLVLGSTRIRIPVLNNSKGN